MANTKKTEEKTKELKITESGIKEGQEVILTVNYASSDTFFAFTRYPVISLKRTDEDSIFYDEIKLHNPLTGKKRWFKHDEVHNPGRSVTSNGISIGEEVILIANNGKKEDLKVGRKYLVAVVDSSLNYGQKYEEVGLWDPTNRIIKWYMLSNIKPVRILEAKEDERYQFGEIIRMIADKLLPNHTTVRNELTSMLYTLRINGPSYTFLDKDGKEAMLGLNEKNLNGRWIIKKPKEKVHRFKFPLFNEGANYLNYQKSTGIYSLGDDENAGDYQAEFSDFDISKIVEQYGPHCLDGAEKIEVMDD